MLLLTACTAGGATSDTAEWASEVEQIGDTTIVRTISGSTWGEARLVPELRIGSLDGAEHELFGRVTGLAVGADGEIYVYDRQARALRRYGPDGGFLGTLGRPGPGPGEYENSDGGLAVLADGRVVLRDPGNARFTVYAPDGTYLERLAHAWRRFQLSAAAGRNGWRILRLLIQYRQSGAHGSLRA